MKKALYLLLIAIILFSIFIPNVKSQIPYRTYKKLYFTIDELTEEKITVTVYSGITSKNFRYFDKVYGAGWVTDKFYFNSDISEGGAIYNLLKKKYGEYFFDGNGKKMWVCNISSEKDTNKEYPFKLTLTFCVDKGFDLEYLRLYLSGGRFSKDRNYEKFYSNLDGPYFGGVGGDIKKIDPEEPPCRAFGNFLGRVVLNAYKTLVEAKNKKDDMEFSYPLVYKMNFGGRSTVLGGEEP